VQPFTKTASLIGETVEEIIERVFLVDSPENRGIEFTEEILRESLDKYRKRIEENNAFGWLYFRDIDGLVKRQCPMPTHQVLSVKQCEDRYTVKVRILHTPEGEELYDLIRDGRRYCANISGSGELDSTNNVVRGFEIHAINLVPVECGEVEL